MCSNKYYCFIKKKKKKKRISILNFEKTNERQREKEVICNEYKFSETHDGPLKIITMFQCAPYHLFMCYFCNIKGPIYPSPK